MKPLLLATALLSPQTFAAKRPKDAVLLSNVKTLTLRGPYQKTTHRRLPPVPQLKCLSSPALCALAPLTLMRCENRGSSYGAEDIEWTCTTTVPEEVELASTDVICEGYDGSDDDYVLKGSCGVEYRLVLSKRGEKMHPDIAKGSQPVQDIGIWGWVFFWIFLAVAGWIIYSAYNAHHDDNNNPRRPPRRRPGGGGGGGPYGGGGGGFDPGFGGPDDPPPPYPGKSQPRYQQQSPGWRPGFWTGLGAGTAAGYTAGSRRNRDRNDGYNRDEGYNRGSSGAGPSTSGASHHQSSGFGSTSRR